jgi:hypothetical protein
MYIDVITGKDVLSWVVYLLLLVGLSAFDVHGINNKYVDLHNNHEWIRHSVIVSLCGRLVYDVKIYYCRRLVTPAPRIAFVMCCWSETDIEVMETAQVHKGIQHKVRQSPIQKGIK